MSEKEQIADKIAWVCKQVILNHSNIFKPRVLSKRYTKIYEAVCLYTDKPIVPSKILKNLFYSEIKAAKASFLE